MQFQIRTNLKFNLRFQISITAVNIFGSNHIQIIDITLFIIYFHIVFVLELFTAVFLKGGLTQWAQQADFWTWHKIGKK